MTLSELPPGRRSTRAIEAAGVTSLMASPLLVKGQVAGVVEVGSTGARRFTLEDESLLMLMADRAGLAIEHARAYERELSNVEMLQRSLLPERLPEHQGHPGRGLLHARWRGRGRATGTTRSRSTAAGWGWRWATWWATASAPPR